MHVAVTGASSGIGEALVREFARAGAAITLVARRRERMEGIVSAVGGRTQIFAVDLSVVERACDWLEPAQTALGPIDLLINNAGVMRVGATATMDEAQLDAMMRIDLLTPLRLCRAVLPAMLARRAGSIVNIASMAAIAPTPGMAYYNAAKAGLGAASESLRGELRKTGVSVVTVYPGPVETALARASYEAYEDNLAKRIVPKGTVEVLARRVRRAVERRRARVIYPRLYTLARHFPAITRLLLDWTTPPVKSA